MILCCALSREYCCSFTYAISPPNDVSVATGHNRRKNCAFAIIYPTYVALTNAPIPSKNKPYTAITVQVNRLTSEHYEADDMSGIPDLIEVIRIQTGGPTEAARAIRKKL